MFPAPLNREHLPSHLNTQDGHSRLTLAFWNACRHLDAVPSRLIAESPVDADIKSTLSLEIERLSKRLQADKSFRDRFDSTVSSFSAHYEPYAIVELMEALQSGSRDAIDIEILGFYLACAKLANVGSGFTSEVVNYHDPVSGSLSKTNLPESLLHVYRSFVTEDSNDLFSHLIRTYKEGSEGDERILLLGMFAPLASVLETDARATLEAVVDKTPKEQEETFGSALNRVSIETIQWSAPVIDLPAASHALPAPTEERILPNLDLKGSSEWAISLDVLDGI